MAVLHSMLFKMVLITQYLSEDSNISQCSNLIKFHCFYSPFCFQFLANYNAAAGIDAHWEWIIKLKIPQAVGPLSMANSQRKLPVFHGLAFNWIGFGLRWAIVVDIEFAKEAH
jgi:hypothetical protein